MGDSPPMIEVEHLTKEYGAFTAVRDVSFSVPRGEVVGFLGPNGAGKSTTLRILAGFLGATSGTLRVAGHDVATAPLEVRRKTGYMPESCPLYPEMRVREYLRYRAELKGIASKRRAPEVERVAGDARVADMLDVSIGHLSKGYRQRVGLADALLGSPPLLILDEPTAGLDPNQIREVRDLVKRLGESHTVFVSTHILSEVEHSCSRAIVIARGELVAEGSLAELRDRGRSTVVSLVVRGDGGRARQLAAAAPGVARATLEAKATVERPLEPGTVRLRVEFATADASRAGSEAVVRALVEARLGVREVTPEKATLEEIFAELTESPSEAALAPLEARA
jgi:ABC-2 type transport system ATP-binding protein